MKNSIKSISVVFLCFVSLLAIGVYAKNEKEHTFHWKQKSGKWYIQNSKLIEKRRYSIKWDKFELFNFNTVLSTEQYKNFGKLSFDIKFRNPISRVTKPKQAMAVFAARSKYKGYHYHTYALKFSGDNEKITSISLLYSDQLEKSDNYRLKGNYFVKILKEKTVKLKYNKVYRFNLDFDDKEVNVRLGKNSLIKTNFPSSNFSGHIGFSSRFISVEVDDLKLYSKGGFLKKREVIFEDNFDTGQVQKRRLKARIIKKK